MGKEVKTNAMRMLDRQKIPYELMNYECEEFVDGMDVADKLGQDYEMTFKTLVTLGKSGNYYVYAIPVHRELDMKKAARAVGEKHVEMVPVKEINKVTGYIRRGSKGAKAQQKNDNFARWCQKTAQSEKFKEKAEGKVEIQ